MGWIKCFGTVQVSVTRLQDDVQYLAIYNNTILPNITKNRQSLLKMYQILNTLPNFVTKAWFFVKVAKLRQIWSHWSKCSLVFGKYVVNFSRVEIAAKQFMALVPVCSAQAWTTTGGKNRGRNWGWSVTEGWPLIFSLAWAMLSRAEAATSSARSSSRFMRNFLTSMEIWQPMMTRANDVTVITDRNDGGVMDDA